MSALFAAGPIAKGLFGLVDQLFTSDEEREAAKFKILSLESEGKLAQIAVNMQEAKHGSVFVAGWRPFVGWTCGASFAWTFALQPVAQFALTAAGHPIDLPQVDLSEMMPVLLGMLGLGAMRSWEKRGGVARDEINKGK